MLTEHVRQGQWLVGRSSAAILAPTERPRVAALHAYCNRTGADMTQWFGQHQVPTKVNRQARMWELAA